MFKWFHKKASTSDAIDIVDLIINSQADSLRETEAAIEKAIDLIAKMTAKAKFKVYEKNVDVMKNKKSGKTHIYYLLNCRPNDNENAYHFWRRAVKKMIRDEECLIYTLKDKLFIADSFQKSNDIYNNVIFTNIVTGNMRVNKEFTSDNVIWLKNTNTKSRMYLHSFNKAYGDFLSITFNAYKACESKKYNIKIPAIKKFIDSATDKEVTKSQFMQSILDKLSSDKTEAIMLGREMEIGLINGTLKGNADAFLKIVNQINEQTAMKFDIPIDIFNGKTTEKSNAMNDFITDTISVYARIIEDALNSFFCSEKEFIEGSYIKADLTSIKYLSLVDNAVQLEKLFGIGFSHNDLRETLGIPVLNEDWANAHFISKNNGTAENVLEGGGENG